MKYYIYGKGKLQLDFQNMFSHMEISGYIDENNLETKESVEEFLAKIEEEFKIIVCRRNEEEVIEKLSGLGLEYGKEFCLASDMFYQLEKCWSQANGRKIYVWGIGNKGEDAWRKISDIKLPIEGYIDNKVKSGYGPIKFHEYEVYNPEKILKEDIYIIVAVSNEKILEEIKLFLDTNGRRQFKDYILSKEIGVETNLMRKVYYAYADQNNTFVCRHAFEYLQIERDGTINNCCPDYIYCKSIGNLMKDNFHDIWNSMRVKLFRLSIMNHTYALCNRKKCLFLNEYKPEKEDKSYDFIPCKDEGLIAYLNFDASCNLYCSSCRNHITCIKGKEKERAVFLADKVQKEIIPSVASLYVAGYGEFFASKIYQNIVNDIEHIPHVGILSNGLLFNEEYVKCIKNKSDSVSVMISIDAASKITYEKIRRGGNFEQLLGNLYKIRDLRRNGIISFFGISFVVQYDNYKEIADFIKLGQELEVDNIEFTKINNWGTYTPEEFERISLFDENGLKDRFKQEFDEVDFANEKVLSNSLQSKYKKYLYGDYDIRRGHEK